jgi:hypothetical protein
MKKHAINLKTNLKIKKELRLAENEYLQVFWLKLQN